LNDDPLPSLQISRRAKQSLQTFNVEIVEQGASKQEKKEYVDMLMTRYGAWQQKKKEIQQSSNQNRSLSPLQKQRLRENSFESVGLKYSKLDGEALKQKVYGKLKDSEAEIIASARHNKSIEELHKD